MFNRLILFLFALLLICMSFGLVLISMGWTTPVDFLNTVNGDLRVRIIFGISGGVVLILGLYTFLLSIFKQPLPYTIVENTSLGEIHISVRAIENVIQQTAMSIRGIRDIKPNIRTTEKGVILFLKTIVGPEANIPETSKELQDKVKGILESSAGIKVLEVRVAIMDVNPDAKVRVH